MSLNIPDLRLYKGDNPYSQGDNYHLFITGPLVFPYLSPSDLFRQTGESWTNDIHIHFWQAVKALLLAEQGLLYELTDINYINSEEIIPLIEKLRIPLTSSALYILEESPAYNFFLGFVNKQTHIFSYARSRPTASSLRTKSALHSQIFTAGYGKHCRRNTHVCKRSLAENHSPVASQKCAE